MSDLPRFHTGKSGSLSFTDLNEVMKRLDTLRPVTEGAGVSDESTRDGLPLIFMVYAQRQQGEPDDRYEWREVVLKENNEILDEDDEDFEEYVAKGARIRSGGMQMGNGLYRGDYALDVLGNGTNSGYGLLITTNQTDGSVRRIIIFLSGEITTEPVDRLVDMLIVRFHDGEEEFTYTYGTGTNTVQLNKYVCHHLTFGTGGLDDWDHRTANAVLYDFSRNQINYPLTNAPTEPGSVKYQVLRDGTVIVGAQRASNVQALFYWGSIPRLSFNCI